MKVATHPNYPPFHFVEDGKLVGPSINLAKQLGKDMQIDVVIQQAMPWKRVLVEAEKGSIDAVVGLKKTSEREIYLSFSHIPLFANPMSVFVKKRFLPKFNSWLDLIGAYGAVSAGDSFGDEFDSFSRQHLELATAPDPNSLLDMLVRDRVDYIVLGRYTTASILSKKRFLNITPAITVNTGLVHLGISKRSACAQLLPSIDKLLLKYLQERTFTQQLEESLDAFGKG